MISCTLIITGLLVSVWGIVYIPENCTFRSILELQDTDSPFVAR